ncbi:acyl-CoA thioesterase [Natrialba asiatica]|uniref:acyl-CoA thioesterase n=1 Tax=Natrialba asiatica TaxID=64602 RepID=UPI0023A96EAD|nr:thioesterase family protein [Natrialba asiatica]
MDEVDTVIIELHLEYKTPIKPDQRVEVAVRIDGLGELSITKAYEIRADGDVAATARTTQVVIDGETSSTVSIPDEWRRWIKENRDSDTDSVD